MIRLTSFDRAQRNQRTFGRQFGLLVCFWPVVALAVADAGTPRVLDRAVAAVEGQVITWSQLEFEARVLLVNAGGVEASFAPLDLDVLRSSLTAVIDQRLATLEADKLDAFPLEAGELEKAIASFRSRFATESKFREFLDAHEADLNDLAQVLRRSLRAQRALEGKLRLKAQVTESEARRYLSEHPELSDLTVDIVRQRLFAMRFQGLVKQELAQQRKTVDVRLLGPFAPKPEGQ